MASLCQAKPRERERRRNLTTGVKGRERKEKDEKDVREKRVRNFHGDFFFVECTKEDISGRRMKNGPWRKWWDVPERERTCKTNFYARTTLVIENRNCRQY